MTTTTKTVADVRKAFEENLDRLREESQATDKDAFERAYVNRFVREAKGLLHWTSEETNDEGALDDNAAVLDSWVSEAYKMAYKELADSINVSTSAMGRLERQAEATALKDFAEALERAITYGATLRGGLPRRP